MREEGLIEVEREATDEGVRRFDKGRKDKRLSDDERQSSTDPDSRIAKVKDGRTLLAYKAQILHPCPNVRFDATHPR
jgi:hypothetical protein